MVPMPLAPPVDIGKSVVILYIRLFLSEINMISD
jgi:hypothetical protein